MSRSFGGARPTGRPPCEASSCPTTRDQAVESEQYDCPQGGHEDGPDVESRGPRSAEKPHDEPPDYGPRHPNENGHEETPRVVARHDQFAQHACYQADYDPAYDAHLDAPLVRCPPAPVWTCASSYTYPAGTFGNPYFRDSAGAGQDAPKSREPPGCYALLVCA